MAKALVITEKPSVARDIVSAIGSPQRGVMSQFIAIDATVQGQSRTIKALHFRRFFQALADPSQAARKITISLRMAHGNLKNVKHGAKTDLKDIRVGSWIETFKSKVVNWPDWIKQPAKAPSPWTAKLPLDRKFVYDGIFVPNPKLLGEWTPLGQVATIDEFAPGQKIRRARISGLVLKSDGRTESVTRIWSGDTLMDLSRYEALKIERREIGDREYLFVEAGGFKAKHAEDWKSPWYVFERHTE